MYQVSMAKVTTDYCSPRVPEATVFSGQKMLFVTFCSASQNDVLTFSIINNSGAHCCLLVLFSYANNNIVCSLVNIWKLPS